MMLVRHRIRIVMLLRPILLLCDTYLRRHSTKMATFTCQYDALATLTCYYSLFRVDRMGYTRCIVRKAVSYEKKELISQNSEPFEVKRNTSRTDSIYIIININTKRYLFLIYNIPISSLFSGFLMNELITNYSF